MSRLALLFVAAVLCAFSITARARSSIGFSLEPIIGYDRVQKLTPTAHTTDRLVYGGRLIVGVPLLSVEVEYTRGTDHEDFPTSGLSTKDTADKGKLGVRSSIGLGKLFSFIARAGAQGSRTVHESTSAGVTTRTETPIEYDPYAGAGLRIRFGRRSQISLAADLTAVITDTSDLSKNEYLLTSGFAVHL